MGKHNMDADLQAKADQFDAQDAQSRRSALAHERDRDQTIEALKAAVGDHYRRYRRNTVSRPTKDTCAHGVSMDDECEWCAS